jgi:ABC-type phosphate transport system auxiliary subunit
MLDSHRLDSSPSLAGTYGVAVTLNNAGNARGAKAGTQNGFVAQEVEPLFPDWVSTDAKGMKMLSISGFESLTVAALRELQAEKDAQLKRIEAQNAKLQEQNQSLEQRLAALEKLINRLSATKGDAQ